MNTQHQYAREYFQDRFENRILTAPNVKALNKKREAVLRADPSAHGAAFTQMLDVITRHLDMLADRIRRGVVTDTDMESTTNLIRAEIFRTWIELR